MTLIFESEKIPNEDIDHLINNGLSYLDLVVDNNYKKCGIKEYFLLLKKEISARWIKGRDFNDQDRNSLHRAIKDIPLEIVGYNE